jgi:hypothetical protein
MRISSIGCALICASAALAAGCGGGGEGERDAGGAASSTPVAERRNVSTDKKEYPVFPDAD